MTLAQNTKNNIIIEEPCYSGILLEKSLKENPNLIHKVNQSEEEYRKELSSIHNRTANSTSPITIPIVVYIVHDGTSTINITDTQVQSQLTALNNYFQPLNINFCLATKQGTNPIPVNSNSTQSTPGIIHVNNSTLSNHDVSIASQQQLINGTTVSEQVSPDNYLRIWVVKDILENGSPTGILGYSPTPLIPSALDGVVIKYSVFGDNTNCTNCYNLLANYNQGKTLIHEIGHYLGLYHTFQDGCLGSNSDFCSEKGDKVCDTPQSSYPITNCDNVINSCPENIDNDDLANFMGYTIDQCKNHFTLGQKERMLSVVYSLRSILVSTDNLVYVGACSENLISSAISIDTSMLCSNTQATFYAPYTNTTLYSYLWNFGDPTSSNNTASTPSATHSYANGNSNPYIVSLTVTRNSDGMSSTSTKEIYVVNCQPINNHKSTWYVGSANLLKFNSGIPIFDNNFPSISANFGAYPLANQNDNQGNLLFYTNKLNVLNSNNDVINIGGNYLAVGLEGYDYTSTIIVPKPNTINKYYILTNSMANANQNIDNSHGFRYSEIEVNGSSSIMNSIRQEITIPTSENFQNQLGTSYGGMGITAIKKSNTQNDNSYWIITTASSNDNKRFLVVFSLDGTSTNGGFAFNSKFELSNISGNSLIFHNIESAPNGNKIFVYSPSANVKPIIFDFNKAEGIISNPIPLTVSSQNFRVGGASFSPDSKLLYYIDNQRRLIQVNLNSSDIDNSKITILNKPYGQNDFIETLQIGPDGKIYIIGSSKNLKVIFNPNTLSTTDNLNACNYFNNGPKKVTNSINIPTFLGSSLPNIIDAEGDTAYTNSNSSITYYTAGCNTFKFFPDYYGQSFQWDFGDVASGSNNYSDLSNPTHTFTVGSNPSYTFLVTLKNSSGVIIAQKEITINNPTNMTITGSSSACTTSIGSITNNHVEITSSQSIIWTIIGGSGIIQGSNNQSNVLINWSQLPGTITASITNSNGCINTISNTISENCCASDITFTSTETSSEMTYNASNSIITNTNYIVNSGSTINLKSGGIIVLGANSHIKNGASFLAILEDCEGNELVNKSITNNQSYKSQYYSTIQRGEANKTEIKNENSLEKTISIYPNPSSSLVTITSTKIKFKSIIIASIEGRKVYSEQLKETMSHQIDISSFPTGIYIISTQDNDGQTFTEKLIKN